MNHLLATSQQINLNTSTRTSMVDVFSYDAPDARHAQLGSLYVVGQRESDDPSVSYIISLIAAMAHRHYFADTTLSNKDAFAGTLRKLNEIVDDFVRVNNAPLSVGVFAVARGTLLASHVDKFKVLLARNGEIIDVFNNLTLFTKEHIEKRRFSNMVSGTLQNNDALLAFVPTKAITTRERFVRTWLARETPEEFAMRLTQAGEKSPTFEGTFLHVMIGHSTVATEEVAPTVLPPQHAKPISDPALAPSLAWAPRQQQTVQLLTPTPQTTVQTSDMPHVIGSEFTLGTRRYGYERWFKLARSIRLTPQIMVVIIGLGIALVALGNVGIRSWLASRSQRLQYAQALDHISTLLTEATQLRDQQNRSSAQERVASALSALTDLPVSLNQRATLAQKAAELLDTIDQAISTSPTLFLQLDPSQPAALIAWSSASNSLWTTHTSEGTTLVRQYDASGSLMREASLSNTVSGIRSLSTSLALWDNTNHELVVLRPQETIHLSLADHEVRDVAFYADNAYILTTTTILKVSAIETSSSLSAKPWLSDATLYEPATSLWIDGSVFTVSPNGTINEYYKGAHRATHTAPSWPLHAKWIVNSLDDRRIIIPSLERIVHYGSNNTLQATQKIESLSTLGNFIQGPNGSLLGISADNKIWKIE